MNLIGPDVTIGAGSIVWQFASVIRGSVIGENCSIGPGSLVDGARIGDRCRINHGVSINPGVVLCDDVMVGPGAVFCNDFYPTTSKDGFDIDALLKGYITVVRVENGASIGANAIILPGVVIGEGAMVAAGAKVKTDVPANCLYQCNGVVKPVRRKMERMRSC